MVPDVVLHEGGDKVVAVIVTRLHPEGRRIVLGLAGLLEQLVIQFLHELILGTLIHQQGGGHGGGLHQRIGIMLCPSLRIVAKVTAERLLSPRALAGSADRCKRGHRAEAFWILECERQGAMPPHRVPKDAFTFWIGGEICVDQFGEFVDDVVVHAVVLRPFLDGCVEVESCSGAKIVAFVLAFDSGATWAGIRNYEHQSSRRRVLLRSGFGDEVLVGTGQSGKPIQYRNRAGFRLGGQEHRKLHFARTRLGSVAENLGPAAEGFVCAEGFEGGGCHNLPERKLRLILEQGLCR